LSTKDLQLCQVVKAELNSLPVWLRHDDGKSVTETDADHDIPSLLNLISVCNLVSGMVGVMSPSASESTFKPRNGAEPLAGM